MTFRRFLLLLTFTLTPLLDANAQAPGASSASSQNAAPPLPCTPEGKIKYICDLQSVEDMILVPGGRWILGSDLKANQVGIYVIDAKTHTAKPAAITYEAAQKPFDACPSPPDKALFRTHGIALRTGKNGLHTFYAINQGGRQSVEVFRVDARAGEPKLAWIGCLILPSDVNPNALDALPDGGLAITKFRDQADRQGSATMLLGAITGAVDLWHPGSGFHELAGGRLAGDNGILVSPGGKWVFISDYGRKKVFRVALDGSGKSSSFSVDFHPDNLRWAPDGKIFLTGQYFGNVQDTDRHGWGTIKFDPGTMISVPYLKVPPTAAFDDASTTIQVGRQVFISPFRGDRVGYTAAH